MPFDAYAVPSPCYVADRDRLIDNLEILKDIQDKTGCKILLAQKAFSMYSLYPLIGKYLSGTTASSLNEAMLGHTEMGNETHIFAPAYKSAEFEQIKSLCGHIVFNSFAQWKKYRDSLAGSEIKCGIRINPEYTEQEHAIYDPCSPFSRLGVTDRKSVV